MSETTDPRADYCVNGHEYHIVQEFDHGGEIVQCRNCLAKDALDEDEDADDYLGLVSADECRIEWLRRPDGRSHGVALRSAGCFRGRELIGVKQDGPDFEVVDSVRVYDDDAPALASKLDETWGGW